MKIQTCIILLVIAAISAFAKGKIEYDITEVLTVDDREKGQDANYFGGDIFGFSNTLSEKTGNTTLKLDINSKPGYNGSKACIHLTFAINSDDGSAYAGVGININPDKSVRDFSQFFGIRFYARGSGNLVVRLTTESSRNTYNDYQYPIYLKSDWTYYEIPFSEFRLPSFGPSYVFKPSEIFAVQWSSVGKETSRNVDLFLDDIAFFKAKIREAAPKTEVAQTENKTSKTTDTAGTVKETGHKKLSQKKLDEVMGMRIAVVGLDSQNIDSKVTKVVVDFIINAFVNSGSVKVVDRSSIEKILKEQAFQMQDFVDNSKVTEIGRLLGAEFVVTGGLNKIEATVYLNIRLISVKTAEIIGSSVTSAPEKSDYVDLCNDAVLKLFM